LGSRELAAHQIALNLASLAFMVPLGISGAAATRVGNAIGRGSMSDARRSAAVCLAFGAAVMTFSGSLFYMVPGLLSRLYTDEADIITLAVQLIPIAALFQVFDGIQVVGAGVLRGTADTRFAAAIALIGYWCFGLPLGAYLAFRQDFGPQGLWLGLSAGLATAAVLFLLRIRYRFRREILAVEDREDAH
jgi:MATE family multidrug resistance protein